MTDFRPPLTTTGAAVLAFITSLACMQTATQQATSVRDVSVLDSVVAPSGARVSQSCSARFRPATRFVCSP